MMQEIIKQLSTICGPERVLTAAADLRHFGGDRSTAFTPEPTAVVLPKTIDEVSAIVRYANGAKLALVPSGGRTGLSGGAVARAAEVVVALDRMDQILEFDALEGVVRCQAGVITKNLQDFARDLNLCYPVDFAATGSSQIGGNIATNAGGINVIRYGMTRDRVRGLTVVTGAGDVLELNKGLLKNNTGYDLRHLFIGSEGTLGIICEAELSLVRGPGHRRVQLLGVPDMSACLEVLRFYRQRFALSAFEFFSDVALAKVREKTGYPLPLSTPAPFYALVEIETEIEGDEAFLEALLQAFETCCGQGWVTDAVLAENISQAQGLWRYREDISETLAKFRPYKQDLSVRVSRLPEFIRDVERVVARHFSNLEVVWYGHIGDGNLHLNILKPKALEADSFMECCYRAGRDIAEVVSAHGGSVSAEHGIGLLKKDWLPYSRSDSEITLMRGIKAMFDPNNIMNPDKIF